MVQTASTAPPAARATGPCWNWPSTAAPLPHRARCVLKSGVCTAVFKAAFCGLLEHFSEKLRDKVEN